jgi:cephalosporin-C deacetylase-like acetyl esterase
MDQHPFSFYPQAQEVDEWIDALWQDARSSSAKAEKVEPAPELHPQINYAVASYIRHTPPTGVPFYSYWQPTYAKSAPLLVHLPGYGAQISMHPDLVLQGYHVLHISPLGYNTPNGPDVTLKKERVIAGQRSREWPVLPNTVTGEPNNYRDWLLNCMQAIQWAISQPDVDMERVSFFGSSQGGGAALLLGSIYRDYGARCVAADIPFLTNFPLADGRGAYRTAAPGFDQLSDHRTGWRALGFVDTLSHASRLTLPVLLTAGADDLVTPPDTIESLFERLPHTRSYTRLHGTGHDCTAAYMHLAAAWFRLYA